MLHSLDIISIHLKTRVKGKNVRRCKQVIEIIDIDPISKEILTNEVFRWDSVEDKFIYTGKSYILEEIRAKWDISKDEISKDIRNRAEIIKWMHDNNVRTYKEVLKVVSRYKENPDEFLEKIRKPSSEKNDKKKDKKRTETFKIEKEKIDEESLKIGNNDIDQVQSQETSDIHLEKSQEEDKKDLEVELNIKINALKNILNIDKEIAILLYDNGFNSVDKLTTASLNDFLRIKNIKRKTAKKIIKKIQLRFNNQIKEEKKYKKKLNLQRENIDNKITENIIFYKDKIIDKEIKIEDIKVINSIDKETAVLLYNNGINSLGKLNNISLKELLKIKGINRKTAKKIIKEFKKCKNIDLLKDQYAGGERGVAK
jgi:hypothetical protein